MNPFEHADESVTNYRFDLQLFAEEAPKSDDPPKGDDPRDGDDKNVSPEYVARLRREAKEAREAKDALQKEKDERERKDLEDQKEFKKLAEREKQRADDAEKAANVRVAKAHKRAIVAELRDLAKDAGLLDPSDIDVIDLSKMKVDDNDDVVGAKEAIDELKARKPHWFKAEGKKDDKSDDKGDKNDRRTPPRQAPPSQKPPESDAYALDKDAFASKWESLGRV